MDRWVDRQISCNIASLNSVWAAPSHQAAETGWNLAFKGSFAASSACRQHFSNKTSPGVYVCVHMRRKRVCVCVRVCLCIHIRDICVSMYIFKHASCINRLAKMKDNTRSYIREISYNVDPPARHTDVRKIAGCHWCTLVFALHLPRILLGRCPRAAHWRSCRKPKA